LSEVTIPTLVRVGEHDLPGCRRIGEETVDRVAGARLEMIANSAHCPPRDQPRARARTVLDWLDAEV